MKSPISENNSQLTNLFESVKRDTPELTRSELIELISTADKAPAPPTMRHTSTFYNKKRIVMSVFVVIALSVGYLLFTDPQHQQQSLITSGREQSSTAPENKQSRTTHQSATNSNEVVVEPASKKAGSIDPKRWELFIHKPIDVSVFHPNEIGLDRFADIGLLQTDSGEIIYYNRTHKIGFPLWNQVFTYEDGKNDPQLTILGMRPFHAEYVTDSRGNMMAHYEVKEIKDGSWVSLSTFDQTKDLSETMKSLKYYGSQTVSRMQTLGDTINDILKLRMIVKVGIMRVDTILTGKISDQRSFAKSEREISLELRKRDSTLKIGLGGMEAIAKNYAFDVSDKTDPLVKQVIAALKKIDTKNKSEIEILSERFRIVAGLIDSEPTIEGKLKLEQYATKLSYEVYLERSKMEAVQLQNPVDLIPVMVRPSTGMKENPKFDNGLIFWYRDSDSLRDALNLPKAHVATIAFDMLSIKPNPAMLYLYIDYEMKKDGPLRISLVEMTGKQVYSEAWKSGGGSGRKEINVQPFAPGIYLLIVDTEQGSVTRQVIIRR